MEIESLGNLLFLDVSQLENLVHRKPTHTNTYLDALSLHHPAHTCAVVNSLARQATSLCDESSKYRELKALISVLQLQMKAAIQKFSQVATFLNRKNTPW